jgi:hypothetical protein
MTSATPYAKSGRRTRGEILPPTVAPTMSPVMNAASTALTAYAVAPTT